MLEKVSLLQKFEMIQKYWEPRIAGEINDTWVKLAKFKDEFVWHHHDDEDEMFLVVKGHLRIELRDGIVELDPGEFVIVPRGVEHRPVAGEEVHCILIEPKSVLNTGNVRNQRTLDTLERI